MKEEIFGPILPVLTYTNFNEVIKFINNNDKPLAIYYFGSKNEHKELLEQKTSSGGLAFNDAAFHLLSKKKLIKKKKIPIYHSVVLVEAVILHTMEFTGSEIVAMLKQSLINQL